MLPYPNREPTGQSELRIGVNVASHVAPNLLRPVVTVSSWDSAVFRATMPEATINKHSNPGRSKHEVSPSPKIGEGLSVYAISQSALVDRRTNGQLWTRVAPPIALHHSSDGERCRSWCFQHHMSVAAVRQSASSGAFRLGLLDSAERWWCSVG